MDQHSPRIQPSQRPVRATAAGPRGTPVVIGVDLGTTSAKVIAVDPELRLWASTANAYALHSPHPGWAEQDPEEVVAAAVQGLHDVRAAAEQHGGAVAGVAVSAAMHSILAVDAAHRPLTAAMTYADSRAAPLAAALRATPEGAELYGRTGVPHHSMSPLFKIRWFTEQRPEIAAAAAQWLSLKEYLLLRLGAGGVVDHSIASGTGMFDLSARAWDVDALRLAGITSDQLTTPVSSTTVLQATGLDVPLVVGAGDGALANLGAGAVDPGTAALSIGTSGAVRITVNQPATDEQMRLFCSALDDDHWVVGGAISNGGIVLRWLRDKLFAGVANVDYGMLTSLAEPVAAGADGLAMLPYLTAERAPFWDGRRGAAILGLDVRHGSGHVVRAALEGVAHQLRLVTDALLANGLPIDQLRASGGFTASRLWVQIVADILERDIVVPEESEGSSLGAVLLGMVALGQIGNVEDAARAVPLGDTVHPDPDTYAVYRAAHDRFRTAAQAP